MESNFNIYNDDCLDRLNKIKADSIDCIVTDPPYELNFMGKGWDNAGVSFNKTTWQKCLRVLKPGGYLLAFGGTRTYHRIACAIEDAGFEIRDCIMWLYGSGFPKSMNIGLAVDKKLGNESKVIGTQTVPDIRGDAFGTMNEKQGGSYKNITRDIKEAQNEWKGWGTALKPSYEPIIVARKPFKGSLVDNVMKYGVGGLNIDECRVGNEVITQLQKDMTKYYGNKLGAGHHTKMTGITTQTVGRFPANTILDTKEGEEWRRYFYCAKASKKDRDEGLEEFEKKTKVFNGKSNESSKEIKDVEKRFTTQARNIHPTVKPTSLMQYLVRLVAPKGATILDPFMGSGSTGKAVMYENKDRDANYKFIGIEKDAEYCKIAEARIKYAEGGNDVKSA